MKLLYCEECHDVVRLVRHHRECECGQTGGRYINEWEAEVHGEFIPLALGTKSFWRAVKTRAKEWPGNRITAFLIPENADRLHEVTKDGAERTSEADEAEKVRRVQHGRRGPEDLYEAARSAGVR